MTTPDKQNPRDENPVRDEAADWLEAIGDEDMTEEEKVNNIEGYGFNLMDEDDFESDPTMPADMPTWKKDMDKASVDEAEIRKTIDTHDAQRAVEDQAIEDAEDDTEPNSIQRE